MAGSVAVPLALLERDGEVERIGQALERAREGHGSVLAVEGPAGIGKTQLLAATRAAARERGMRVLRARGAELEQRVRVRGRAASCSSRRWRSAPGTSAVAGRRQGRRRLLAGGVLGLGDAEPATAVRRAARALLAGRRPRRRAPALPGRRRRAVGRRAVAAAARVPAARGWRSCGSRSWLGARPREGAARELLATITGDAGAAVVAPEPLSPEAVGRLRRRRARARAVGGRSSAPAGTRRAATRSWSASWSWR